MPPLCLVSQLLSGIVVLLAGKAYLPVDCKSHHNTSFLLVSLIPKSSAFGIGLGSTLHLYPFMVLKQPEPLNILAANLHLSRVRDLARTVARYIAPTSVLAYTLTALGQILISWQSGTALGIAIATAIQLIFSDSGQFQRYIPFVLAAALPLIVSEESESPHWLITKQLYDKAFIVLPRLRGSPLLAARDLAFMWAQLQSETNSFKRKNRKIPEIEDRVPYVNSKVYHRQVALFGYAKRVTERSTTSRAGRAISALRAFYRATVALHLILLARKLSGSKFSPSSRSEPTKTSKPVCQEATLIDIIYIC